MFELNVCASKNYKITIADDLKALPGDLKVLTGKNVMIVTDDNVKKLYGNVLDEFLTDKNVYYHVIKSGEDSKNAENFIAVLESMAEKSFLREDAVIAFGGGVVGDLAGFSAACYMRGIKLFMIPTTLLSAVDSSVGGKTAINLKTGKNLCGSFYQPDGVYVNTGFLKTLPEREVRSGLGEVVKYAFLGDVTKDDLDNGVTDELIYKCLKIKRDIVQADERESGDRKLLNLGHTIGHAVERLSGFSLSHGECVTKGLKAALDFSAKLYSFDRATYEKALKILSYGRTDFTLGFSADKIIELIKVDKKTKNGSVDFIAIDKNLKAKTESLPIVKIGELLKDEC